MEYASPGFQRRHRWRSSCFSLADNFPVFRHTVNVAKGIPTGTKAAPTNNMSSNVDAPPMMDRFIKEKDKEGHFTGLQSQCDQANSSIRKAQLSRG